MNNEKKFNLPNRILHWAIALTVSYLVLTILLRMGWMNKDFMAGILRENLSETGIPITNELSVKIAKDLRRPMWNTHILAGYVLIGLYALRMILNAARGLNYPSPFRDGLPGKERVKAALYLVFYGLLFVSLITGFFIVNGPAEWKNNLEFIHVKSLYYVLTFIALHVCGVLIANFREEPGIISKMFGEAKPERETQRSPSKA